MYRVGEVTEVRVQQARREIGERYGCVRPAVRTGIQPEQADERVGGAAKSGTGWVIRYWLGDQMWIIPNHAAERSDRIATENNALQLR